MDKNEVKDFHAVFREELEVIGKPGAEGNLTGLAFSGGGIRSATFNLGIIQSLARKTLLEKFDYLSTVSGGGYIGSWLSAQIHRGPCEDAVNDDVAGKQKVEGFQESLRAKYESGTEHDAIKWLRSYSNYLTPRKGLSGDTLSAIGTWLRNTFLNQVALSLFFASLILLPQVTLLTFNDVNWLSTQYSNQWLLLSAALICCAIVLCAANLPKPRCCADGKTATTPKGETRWLTLTIIFLAVCAAYCLSLWIYSTSFWVNAWTGTEAPSMSEQISLLKSLYLELPLTGDSKQTLSPLLTTVQSYWSPLVIAGMMAVIYVLPWIYVAIRSLLKPEFKRCAQCQQDKNRSQPPAECAHAAEQATHSPLLFASLTILFAIAAGVFGGWLISLLSHAVAQQNENVRLWWAAGFGTPLLLLIFCTILVLHQGLMGRLFRISQLEWWARLGGYVLFIAAAWAGGHALLIYAPPLIDMLEYKFVAAGGLVWVAHSLTGVILGKSAATSGKGNVPWKEWITRAAPYVFVLGYLVAVSWGVHALMHRFGTTNTPQSLNLAVDKNQPPQTFCDYLMHALQINNSADITALWYILAAGTAVFLVLAWRLDVNLFSIHHFYRNRLTRCYLGAGRGKQRMPNPFTGFDPCDDIRLADLKQRPLHLINTALNLVHDSSLAWQDRKAFSFTFSPVACGFQYPSNQYPPNASQRSGGYYGSAQYMSGVRLGTAMAASGAAASPNMGYHSSPAVAFLLTVFNVRLGHWCPNTAAQVASPNAIKRESPAIGGEYLLRELFGQTDDEKDFVYISDGGHFENLAVYELVRRRCRYIMVVDAGQDKDRNFEDAANMIRKCYIDFGATIDIDLEALRKDKDGMSSSCYALGDIAYPPLAGEEDAKENDNWGVLLYIKPSLIQETPVDILQYAKTNKDFPHQTTADQFFDEAQFESYRHLGNFIMDQVLMSVSQKRTRKDKTWDWDGA